MFTTYEYQNGHTIRRLFRNLRAASGIINMQRYHLEDIGVIRVIFFSDNGKFIIDDYRSVAKTVTLTLMYPLLPCEHGIRDMFHFLPHIRTYIDFRT